MLKELTILVSKIQDVILSNVLITFQFQRIMYVLFIPFKSEEKNGNTILRYFSLIHLSMVSKMMLEIFRMLRNLG